MDTNNEKQNRIFKVPEKELIRLSAEATTEALKDLPVEAHVMHMLFSAIVVSDLCKKLVEKKMFVEEENNEDGKKND
jgi:hypothetical protein